MEVKCLALKDLASPKKAFGLRKVEDDGCQSEHKENMCLEWRRSTPLKSPDAPSALLPNRNVASPALANITPIKDGALTEAWSPTANLKMLISAASPDIRDREMKKVLFRPMENDTQPAKSLEQPVVEDDAEVEDYSQFEEMEEAYTEKKPSRKQKSLGLLCQKFLALYPDYPPLDNPIWISLDKVATSLGVERRRIYDIVNVLESLMFVGRMAKNSYMWYGRRKLEAMLKELQSRGREQGFHLHMEPGAETRDCGANREEGEGGPAGSNRKDKSLRVMSQKFVMLFLVSNSQTLTLDTAAKILIEDTQDSTSHSKYKTKVRRLYDIANVLTSLGLIKKVHVREDRGRKPAFQWLGPTEFDSTGTLPPTGLEATQIVRRQDLNQLKLSRHSSFNITPTSVAVQRQVCSAPCSPHREQAAAQSEPVDYSRKAAVCQLQFGSSSDPHPTTVAQPLPSLFMYPLQPNPATPQHSPSSSPRPHTTAYLPSLSQPPVVLLFRAAHTKPQGPEGQRSPQAEGEEATKRKREGQEEELPTAKKAVDGAENEVRKEDQNETRESTESPVSEIQPYLYVPNSADLNSLNFLLSSAHSAPSLAPTLVVPYVLLQSSSVPAYSPLINSTLQTPPGSKSHPRMTFGLPPNLSPEGQFVEGTAGVFSREAEVSRTIQTPSTPEQTQLYGASTPSTRVTSQEPITPRTPKENTASAASKSFFQTPATSANALSSAPNVRKRGSAQRRLDVGHLPTK